MPAAEAINDDDIKDVDCVEQDDDDEVFPQLQNTESTNFFFCHQTEFQRHLLFRLLTYIHNDTDFTSQHFSA